MRAGVQPVEECTPVRCKAPCSSCSTKKGGKKKRVGRKRGRKGKERKTGMKNGEESGRVWSERRKGRKGRRQEAGKRARAQVSQPDWAFKS